MDSQIKTMAAIEFLQNPKLRLNGLQEKLDFLKLKGLSQAEIDEAINLALVKKDGPSGKWNFLIIVGLFVGGFKLYEYYSQNKPKEEAEEQAKPPPETDKSDKTKEPPVTKSFEDIINEIKKLKDNIEWCRSNTCDELKSIKTLMLGHEKFAAPPIIPSWQIEDDAPTPL